MSMKMISPLEVGLGVRDLPRMRHFYENALGCQFVNEVTVPADKARQAALSDGGYIVVRLQTSYGERIKLLTPFRVDSKLMAATGNPKVKFMHCLPAFHNAKTKVGKQIAAQYPQFADGIEVTDEVFEGPACIAFEQAENRMHTIKAVMAATLGWKNPTEA